jgi:hypothetical protein
MGGKCDNEEGGLIEYIRFLGLGDIREGVTLQMLGCTQHECSSYMGNPKIEKILCFHDIWSHGMQPRR